jgi:hypothetical protein
MSALDLLEELRKRPFEPFRMIVSDSSFYDIHHPEQCVVGISSVVVGIPAKPGLTPYERLIRIDNSHILKIEPLGGNTPPLNTPMSA